MKSADGNDVWGDYMRRTVGPEWVPRDRCRKMCKGLCQAEKMHPTDLKLLHARYRAMMPAYAQRDLWIAFDMGNPGRNKSVGIKLGKYRTLHASTAF